MKSVNNMKDIRLSPGILDPKQLYDPPYYRIRRDPAVPRTFSIREVRTHARFPGSAFAHSYDTSFKHGGGIPPPDFESILVAKLIIGAGYFLASV
jgi:hypothetical protein